MSSRSCARPGCRKPSVTYQLAVPSHVTIAQAARMVGVHHSRIWHLARQEKLPAITYQHTVMIARDAVERYVSERERVQHAHKIRWGHVRLGG